MRAVGWGRWGDVRGAEVGGWGRGPVPEEGGWGFVDGFGEAAGELGERLHLVCSVGVDDRRKTIRVSMEVERIRGGGDREGGEQVEGDCGQD